MSTSKLQRRVSELLSIHLGQYTIRENYRPEWLSTENGGRLELDFYIEELKTAIEVQGQQHYVFVPMFHQDYNGFVAQLERDKVKQFICRQHGIILLEVANEDDALATLPKLDSKIQLPPHPKAIQQANKNYSTSTKKGKRRYAGGHLYPTTINKHLRKIFKILSKKQSEDQITDRELRRLYISLGAIEQYQEAKKANAAFDCQERTMLLMARRIVTEKHDPQERTVNTKHKGIKKPSAYGTIHSRRRARHLLTAQELEPNTWLITGGEVEHTVIVSDATYICDCGNQEQSKDGMCSHVLAVWLAINGNLKR